MVTTRRQEQLMSTPPSQQQKQQQQQQQQEASPATPAGAGAGGAAPSAQGPGGTALRLKSALKPARLAAVQDDEGGEDGTLVGAGIKKRVRIHSANNMVHEFQTSMSTDDVGLPAGPTAGLRDSEGASDEERTPDSSGPRRRRPPTPAHPHLRRGSRFLASVFHSSSGGSSADSSSRGASSRGSTHSARGRDALGMLFTLSWMLASSALIFANKQLMVDHGFRFPFALTSLGQAASTLLGEAAAAQLHSCLPTNPADQMATRPRILSVMRGVPAHPAAAACRRALHYLAPPVHRPRRCSLAGVSDRPRSAAPAAPAGHHAHAAAPCVAQLCCLAVPGKRRLPGAVG